jgi:hypothetical protein
MWHFARASRAGLSFRREAMSDAAYIITTDVNLCDRNVLGRLTAGTRTAVEQAGIVLIPDDGFREYEGPVFPQGTVDFLHFLRDRAPSGTAVEIAVEDTDYKEVALHFDIIRLATLFVEYIAAPTVATLIAEYLTHRLGSRLKSAEARTAIVIHKKDGDREETVRIAYEGPAMNVGGALHDAISTLGKASQPSGIAATPVPPKTLPDTPKHQGPSERTKRRKNRR